MVGNRQEFHQTFSAATISKQRRVGQRRDLEGSFQGALLQPQKTTDGGNGTEQVCLTHGPSGAGEDLSLFQIAPFFPPLPSVKFFLINPLVF